jgi:hypothetical protein
MTGDSVDLVGQSKCVLLEVDAVARIRRQPPCVGFARRLAHAGHPTKALVRSNDGFSPRIPGTENTMSDHTHDPEQERAQIREQLPEAAQQSDPADDGERDAEGHEPLPGLVGDRIKDASEPNR